VLALNVALIFAFFRSVVFKQNGTTNKIHSYYDFSAYRRATDDPAGSPGFCPA
jgi:hypothetical protein